MADWLPDAVHDADQTGLRTGQRSFRVSAQPLSCRHHDTRRTRVVPAGQNGGNNERQNGHCKCTPFIYYEDLYSASSRLLLRSVPDPCTAKKNSFQARVECVGKNHGDQTLCQRKPIPHGGTNHRVGYSGTPKYPIRPAVPFPKIQTWNNGAFSADLTMHHNDFNLRVHGETSVSCRLHVNCHRCSSA